MNIFILSLKLLQCAQYHCDQHVIKMILESAQMLCTAVLLSGGKAGYRMVHAKHPCTLWALNSLSNWRWLRELAYELNDEYKYRYHREEDHKSVQVIKDLEEPNIPDKGLTPFAQAMPEEFKDPDAVQAYRKYYAGAKFKFATWREREIPDWYIELRKEMGGDAEKEINNLLNPEFMKKKRKAAKLEKEEKLKEKNAKAKGTKKGKAGRSQSAKGKKAQDMEVDELEASEVETESEGQISVYSDEETIKSAGRKGKGKGEGAKGAEGSKGAKGSKETQMKSLPKEESRGRILTRKFSKMLAEKSGQSKKRPQGKGGKKVKSN